MPIPVPAGVTVTVAKDGNVTVKGPKGTIEQALSSEMAIEQKDGVITVTRPGDGREHRSLHGLTRTLLSNMVVGVTEGFKKELDVNGVGFRAQKQGKQLVLNIGYSHQVIIEEIPGITIEVPAVNKIIVSGSDKQMVGQFAANIRACRPPEPYKGKGIKYSTEVIRRKEGKAGGKKK
jgi:large subunit ribosomal protein L6